jgi:membrane protease YdiL (CAAX protease family)
MDDSPRPAVPADPLIVSQPATTVLVDLVAALGLYIAARIGLAYLTPAIFGGQVEGIPASGWVVAGQRTVLCVVTVLILVRLLAKNGQSVASLGLCRDGIVRACLWGLAAYATFLAAMMAAKWLVGTVWPDAIGAIGEAQDYNRRRLGPMGIADAAVFCLATAICEELLFRGLLLTRLRRLTGSWAAAIIIATAAFALVHVRQGWVPVGLLFGPCLVLGVWMVWRRNVLVTIVAHFLYDATALALLNPDWWSSLSRCWDTVPP